MTLLKIESGRKEYKLVGATLPPQDHIYLSLYCLAKGTAKAKIVKRQIEEWISFQRHKRSEANLIRDIARRVEQKFADAKRAGTYLGVFSDYKKQMEAELTEKLPRECVIEILKLLP